jgi:hypothetical protein
MLVRLFDQAEFELHECLFMELLYTILYLSFREKLYLGKGIYMALVGSFADYLSGSSSECMAILEKMCVQHLVLDNCTDQRGMSTSITQLAVLVSCFTCLPFPCVEVRMSKLVSVVF